MEKGIFSIIQQLRDEQIISDFPLSQLEIQRAEKVLKSYQKTGEALSQNTIERVIAFFNEGGMINLFYANQFNNFRKAIEGEEIPLFEEQSPNFTDDFRDQIKLILKKYFIQDIYLFIEKLFAIHHYKCLYGFLFFREIIPDEIIERIRAQIGDKLEFTVEKITINPKVTEDQVPILTNPYFFRCANKVKESGQFSEFITDLNNLMVKLTQESNSKLPYKGHYSIYFYQSMKSESNEIYAHNFQLAKENGVIECGPTSKNNPEFKGGLSVVYSVYAEDKPDNNSQEPSNIKTRYLAFFILAGIAILFVTLKTINKRNTTNDYFPAYEDMSDFYDDIEKNRHYLSPERSRFEYLHLLLNNNDTLLTIIDSQVEFKTDYQVVVELSALAVSKWEKNHESITVENQSSQDVIFLTTCSSINYAVNVPANQSVALIVEEELFQLYTGRNYAEIQLHNELGDESFNAFMFLEQSEKDKAILNTDYYIKNMQTGDVIRIEDDKVKLIRGDQLIPDGIKEFW